MEKNLGIILLILAVSVLQATDAPAKDLRGLRSIIRTELIYPRELTYNLPAVLPAKDASYAKNLEYLRVVDALEKRGIVKRVSEGESTRVDVPENNFDIVRRQVNMRYEVLIVNLLLGEWDIEIESVEVEKGKMVVRGRCLVRKTTRIFRTVIDSLPVDERKKYSSTPMRWTIEKVDGADAVSEKAVGGP